MAGIDIRISPDENGLFDLVVENGDFANVTGFETTMVTDIFTDRRADESRVPDARRRRGFIGDVLLAEVGRLRGSQMWTLDQARITAETLNDARNFIIEATQYLVDNGVLQSIDVSVTSTYRAISVSIEYRIVSGETRRYEQTWRRTDAANISNI